MLYIETLGLYFNCLDHKCSFTISKKNTSINLFVTINLNGIQAKLNSNVIFVFYGQKGKEKERNQKKATT